MSLKWPILLLLIAVPITVIIWRRFKKPIIKPIFIAESSKLGKLPSFAKTTRKTKHFLIIDRIILTLLLINILVLVARPLAPTTAYNQEKSRDVIIVMDTSGSVEEYIPSMIDSVEQIIKQNPNERFGIVVFEGLAHPVLPLTRDPIAIEDSIALLRKIYVDKEDKNYAFSQLVSGGTDIGEGILTAVNRFDDLDTYKSRNIILLSDLDQTGGPLDENSEYYMQKVSLIPKYRINFFILKVPTEFDFSVRTEIAEYGGAKTYEVDQNNKDESIKEISNNIFNQIFNTTTSAGKNLVDSPNYFVLSAMTLIFIWSLLRYIRWTKS
ncbi:VWA domain-containing protein [Candidatus Saccharibacteria bacterium]|nr:VWA domain-containing protein [Candidatus Saccharibacteria bacterium]